MVALTVVDMAKKEKPTPIASKAYDVDKVETEELRTLSVLPYEDIVKALNKGQTFVLPSGINRSTVKQSVQRIAEKVKKDVSFVLRKVKKTGQFCYVPIAE